MSRTIGNGPMVCDGRQALKSTTPAYSSVGSEDEYGEGWANKAELADQLAERLRVPRKRAMRLLDTVLRAIGDLLCQKSKVAIKGFGTFESRTRKGRAYKHPLTGESVEVPDKGTVIFKPSKNLLGRVHPVPPAMRADPAREPELVLR